MVIGKIKPTATIVAQFAAGVEIEAIQHEGKIYLPFVGMGEFATSETPTKKAEPVAETTEAPTKKSVEAAPEGKKKYTEEELMDMETKELLKMCKALGIDPDKEEGKNTNKKLRLLILDAQEESGDEDADDEDEDDDTEEKGSEENDLSAKVAEILEDFDGGKKNKKKTIAAICALADDADKKAVTELVDKFEDDADADLDDIADEISEVLTGGSEDDEDDDEEEKPAKKSPKKSKKDENLIDVKDLKVGDRVSVWWDDDNQEWFDGEVKSISKKGKVVIAYDDDTEEAIDEEIHTKIKLLEE